MLSFSFSLCPLCVAGRQTSRLSEDLRRADEARREARVAAESAGLRVLQLEQRVGQLSADKQAADQV